MYSELRESLWQARKHCEINYLDIGPEDSQYIIIPSHSWSHDEWSTAEFAWCLANRLEVRAIIPTRNDFLRNARLYEIVMNPENKNIIELGGIRKKTLEMDSNELNLLRLAYLYFKRRKLDVDLVSFNSTLYERYCEAFNHYLRIEIPQRWRKNIVNSFNFYKELEQLIKIITSLKLPPVDRCRICSNLINDDFIYRASHLLLRALRICTEHVPFPFYSTSLLDVTSQGTLFVNYPVELLLKCKWKRKFRCLICKKKTDMDGFCLDCRNIQGSYNDLFKLGCLEKLDKNVNIKRKKDPRNDNNSSLDINIKERTCVNCKSSFIFSRGNYFQEYFCESCRKTFDFFSIENDIYNNKFTEKDFMNMPELRKQYLITRDG